MIILTTDQLLLDGPAHNIDRILRHNDVVGSDLEHLLNRASILLSILYQNLLIRDLVLSKEGGPRLLSAGVIVQKNGLVLLDRNLCRVKQNLFAGNEYRAGRGSRKIINMLSEIIN